MKEILKRYGLFLISVWVIGLGISMITQSQLGTTAITSLPFVFSAIFPWSFGTFTMLANVLWVLLQIVILQKDFQKKHYLQFMVGPLLSLSIDTNGLLLQSIQYSPYIIKLIFVLIGCLVLAFGIFLQLSSETIYNPTEGIVHALATKFGKSFGDVKFLFDSGLVVASILLSLVVLGNISGIREATILSAFLIGPFTNFFKTHFEYYVESVLTK